MLITKDMALTALILVLCGCGGGGNTSDSEDTKSPIINMDSFRKLSEYGPEDVSNKELSESKFVCVIFRDQDFRYVNNSLFLAKFGDSTGINPKLQGPMYQMVMKGDKRFIMGVIKRMKPENLKSWGNWSDLSRITFLLSAAEQSWIENNKVAVRGDRDDRIYCKQILFNSRILESLNWKTASHFYLYPYSLSIHTGIEEYVHDLCLEEEANNILLSLHPNDRVRQEIRKGSLELSQEAGLGKNIASESSNEYSVYQSQVGRWVGTWWESIYRVKPILAPEGVIPEEACFHAVGFGPIMYYNSYWAPGDARIYDAAIPVAVFVDGNCRPKLHQIVKAGDGAGGVVEE
jgi:hypothetical protein